MFAARRMPWRSVERTNCVRTTRGNGPTDPPPHSVANPQAQSGCAFDYRWWCVVETAVALARVGWRRKRTCANELRYDFRDTQLSTSFHGIKKPRSND